jgi:hypothetical protein
LWSVPDGLRPAKFHEKWAFNVGRVANLRPIANRPSDGALDASDTMNNIRGTGRLAIGRRLATRPTSESGFFDPVTN